MQPSLLHGLRPRFDGADYAPAHDQLRLTGQLARIWNVICDGQWHTLHDLAIRTGDPEGSISAQLRHLRKRRFGAHQIERQRVAETRGTYQYRLVVS